MQLARSIAFLLEHRILQNPFEAYLQYLDAVSRNGRRIQYAAAHIAIDKWREQVEAEFIFQSKHRIEVGLPNFRRIEFSGQHGEHMSDLPVELKEVLPAFP